MEKEQLEAQLHKYYKMSAIFFGVGWAVIGVGVLMLIVGLLLMGFMDVSFMASTPTFFVAGIVLFILDGAIWKRKARNCLKQLNE